MVKERQDQNPLKSVERETEELETEERRIPAGEKKIREIQNKGPKAGETTSKSLHFPKRGTGIPAAGLERKDRKDKKKQQTVGKKERIYYFGSHRRGISKGSVTNREEGERSRGQRSNQGGIGR